MSWAGIDSNQCVSCENLQNAVSTGVFTLKNTIPSSTPAKYKQITRTEAEYYVNINPIPSKLYNQLVVKSDLGYCTPLPYTSLLYFESWEPFYGDSTGAAACANTSSYTPVYTSSSTIGVGTALYLDECGTQQLFANSYDQVNPYFKINNNYVTFENWDATGTGYIIRTITACGGGSSATLDWTVGNQSGGGLIVLNNVGTELINITSTAGSIQSGTLTIPYAQLPYTIRGEWVSGSGNIIRYRVCDLYGGELYYSGAITVGTYEDYVASPTPVYASVYLKANNQTPPVCAV